MIDAYSKILPFYDDTVKQFHRREYRMADLTTFKWIAPRNLLIPFQILRHSRYNTLTEFSLYDTNDVLQYNLLTFAPSGSTSLKTVVMDGHPFDVITYFAQKPFTVNVTCGQYYYKVSDGVETWYSEVFTVEAFDGEYDSPKIINGGQLDGIFRPEPIDILTSLNSIR